MFRETQCNHLWGSPSLLFLDYPLQMVAEHLPNTSKYTLIYMSHHYLIL